MYRDILVATDGSELGQQAADHGLGLGRALDADVHVLAVLSKGATTRDRIRADPEREATDALKDIKATADEKGVAVTTEIRRGDPCDEIVAYADERDVDLIIMGTTTGGRLDKFLYGSVTQCVSDKSPVPVMSVGAETRRVFETSEEAQFKFYCSSCDSTLTVSKETRDALAEKGCILCGASVREDAFAALEVDD